MSLSSDPLFWIIAAIAVTLVGLAKGGFTGVGMVGTPLLALIVPPLQAVAIMLPILLLQDVISVWAYRHHWDAWNLKLLIPGGLIGVAAAGLLAAYVPDAAVQKALADFKGVGRRFQRYGDVAVPPAQGGGRFTVIDDYGHHPVEMAATLAAARDAFPGRRLVLAFKHGRRIALRSAE